jgi:hypothetical protein
LARFWREGVFVTTLKPAGETRLIAAAMVALPMIQQAEQGLATRLSNGVSAFFAPTDPGSSGQNVPSQAASSSANSAQSASSTSLSNSLINTLLQSQSSSGSGQVQGHRHHHGAGQYKAANDMMSQLTGTSGSSGSAGSATSATTAVTA